MGFLRKVLSGVWTFIVSLVRWAWNDRWTALIVVVVLFFVITGPLTYWENYSVGDNDPDRGALVAPEVYGPDVTSIKYLDQNWSPWQTSWYDNVTQGSDLMPYDFFLVLRAPDGQLLRDNTRMNDRYRYLPRKPTSSNPDGLPIGLVKDNYKGLNYMGFTCSACHTGQVNYHGTGYRIDGAPTMADMPAFLNDVAVAFDYLQKNPAKKAQFVKDVLALNGDYCEEKKVLADLDKYAQRLQTYRIVNYSPTKYGFARLDAFGRIFNQVLQYVVTIPDIRAAINRLENEKGKNGKPLIYPEDLKASGLLDVLDKLEAKTRKGLVLNGADRDQIFAAVGRLPIRSIINFKNAIFNSPDAPVSYPFVWDIPQHDYVQWNGIASNAGLGPVGRNAGEVVGVFGTMDWSRGNHWTLAGVFSGQGLFNTAPIRYDSSVNTHNLVQIEEQLKSLWSPQWPFGTTYPKAEEQGMLSRGYAIFQQYCSACHLNIDRTSSNRRIVANMTALDRIKTDPAMATNATSFMGYSGILRNSYVGVGPGDMLIDTRAPVAALLTKSVTGVVATPDADKWWGRRFIEWLWDVIQAFTSNDIKASMKVGDYTPDTTQAPLASDLAYKGRALNGIWATAPYLHNGSVPTLYDLLLPASKEPGDPADMKYRPSKFMVGSREFDPVHIGFVDQGYNGFEFLTMLKGNSNAGHEYGTRDVYYTNTDGSVVLNPDGSKKVKIPALTEGQRMDLLEYLKTL